MLDVNVLLISLLSLYLAKRGKVVTVAGMMNAAAYVGGVLWHGAGGMRTGACYNGYNRPHWT